MVDDPVAVGGDVGVVADQDQRGARVAGRERQQVDDLRAGALLQGGAGGLVGEDRVRLGDQCPGDGDPLRLTAAAAPGFRRPPTAAVSASSA
ncbi:hypothetical protein [Streptomyces sp. Li-HN-5-11]|uniref:hypothetical protein n=1 Tax=Streptomyces sp. Li-HN-5-11 TaxID=3075432 RepID=UPI0037D9CA73